MFVKINRYRNKIKRMTDALEKLGVVGLFQSNTAGLLGGLVFIAVSIVLTKEDDE